MRVTVRNEQVSSTTADDIITPARPPFIAH